MRKTLWLVSSVRFERGCQNAKVSSILWWEKRSAVQKSLADLRNGIIAPIRNRYAERRAKICWRDLTLHPATDTIAADIPPRQIWQIALLAVFMDRKEMTSAEFCHIPCKIHATSMFYLGGPPFPNRWERQVIITLCNFECPFEVQFLLKFPYHGITLWHIRMITRPRNSLCSVS